MTDIQGLISALLPEDLAALRQRGPHQVLDGPMLDAIDRAAGGAGEGGGYYVLRGSLGPGERRGFYLRADVAAALCAPAAVERTAGADA